MQKYKIRTAFPWLSLCATLPLLPSHSAAAATPTDDTQELVITPSRSAEPAQAALANTTIITREQIAASAAADLGQLLAQYTSLDVVRSGGPGQATSVFMRGANSNQTLVMIDGVPVNNGLLGGVDFQYLLSPSDIDHIEIVRGPRSTLYGSGAVGGVINIITRSSQSTHTELQGTWGNEKTYESNLRQEIRSGSFHAAASVGNNNTQGYPLLYPVQDNSTTPSGNFSRHASTSAGWSGQHWQVDAAWQEQMGHTQYLNTFNSPPTPLDQDFNQSLGRLTLKIQPVDFWTSTLNASRNIDSINQRQSFSPFYTGQNRIDWQNDLTLPGHQQLTAGSTYTDQHNQFMANTLTANTFNTLAGYLQDQLNWNDISLLWSGRYEASDVWGDHVTQEATLGYQLLPDHRLYLTRDTAFRAPTSEELYAPASWGGNAALKPETSTNYEIGSKNQWGPCTLNLSVYHQRVNHLIVPTGANYTLENINQAYLRGVETTIGYLQGPWNFNSELDIQRATDLQTDQDLLQRPRRRWSNNLSYSQGQWTGQINWHTASSSMAYGPIPLAGYGVVDLSSSWKAQPWLTLQWGIDNVGNRIYALTANSTTQYYLAQPRLYTVGFTANM